MFHDGRRQGVSRRQIRHSSARELPQNYAMNILRGVIREIKPINFLLTRAYFFQNFMLP